MGLVLDPGAKVLSVLPIREWWAVFREADGTLFALELEVRVAVLERVDDRSEAVEAYDLVMGGDGSLDDPRDVSNWLENVRATSAEQAIETVQGSAKTARDAGGETRMSG